MNTNALAIDQSKKEVVIEFVRFILGKTKKLELRSSIESHDLPTKIMSGIYQSNVQLINNGNPLISLSIK